MAAESSRAALAGLSARELTKRAEQRGVAEERVRRAEADNPEDPRAALIELILAQRPPMRRGGKLAVFLEFCGGQPHHTLFEFSDAVPLHARIRTPTAASATTASSTSRHASRNSATTSEAHRGAPAQARRAARHTGASAPARAAAVASAVTPAPPSDALAPSE